MKHLAFRGVNRWWVSVTAMVILVILIYFARVDGWFGVDLISLKMDLLEDTNLVSLLSIIGESIKSRSCGDIYTVGDSITSGWSSDTTRRHCTAVESVELYLTCSFSRGENLNHTYQYWLDQYMKSNVSAEDNVTSYYNKGRGSAGCHKLYSTFDVDVANNSNAILICGINDLAYGESAVDVEKDMESIYNLSVRKNVTLVFVSILPSGEGNYCDRLLAVNEWIMNFTASRGLRYVNAHHYFTNGTDCYVNQSMFEDGVHPNYLGLQELGKQVWLQGFDGRVLQ
jgi:lysophospholipase L1-like esterase